MKKIIVNKWDTILIKWKDAFSTGTWKNLEDYDYKDYDVNSVGMFLGQSDGYWHITMTHGYTNNKFGDTLAIPKGMITYVEVLKRAV